MIREILESIKINEGFKPEDLETLSASGEAFWEVIMKLDKKKVAYVSDNQTNAKELNVLAKKYKKHVSIDYDDKEKPLYDHHKIIIKSAREGGGLF